jgi:hypothetical protein
MRKKTFETGQTARMQSGPAFINAGPRERRNDAIKLCQAAMGD